MDVIRLLSDSIANQIAAGEVVQRPASVVKELLENSIDAGAKSIQLIVKEAGKQLIQVIDDGKGMSPTDARMSFERHATSKIRESADLFNIRTMGFRGEALASIAAVAQVELKSKRQEDELASHIIIEGSDIKSQEFVQAPAGTNFTIKNLFFNVPARRNFLKANPIEMKHILEEFQRVALAHPEVKFSLFHNDIEIYKLPDALLSKRIIDILDKSYRDQLAVCQVDTDFIKISGFIGKPPSAKKAKGDQFFFVNKRYIKSSYLNHAVCSAFEGTIAQGFNPFYCLFIEIDPKHIDINIHPTKTEIKFDDEKAVYAILRSTARQALQVYNISPSIDFESGISVNSLQTFLNSPKPSFSASSENQVKFESRANTEQRPQQKDNLDNWQKLFSGFTQKEEVQQQVLFESKINNSGFEIPEINNIIDSKIIQIHHRYLLTQVKSGMLLIDQKLAFERIYYEKYLKEFNQTQSSSQQLLFPKTLTLSVLEYQLCLEIFDDLKNIGFDIEEFGQNTLKINGVPAQFINEDETLAIKQIIEAYGINENNDKLQKKERLAKIIAKRNANKMSKDLESKEMQGIINSLFESAMPAISPDGLPILKILNLENIASLLVN